MSDLQLQRTLSREDCNFLRTYRLVPRGSSRRHSNPYLMDFLSQLDEEMDNPRSESLVDFTLSIKEAMMSCGEYMSKEEKVKKIKDLTSRMEAKMRAVAKHLDPNGKGVETAVAELKQSYETYVDEENNWNEFKLLYEDNLVPRRFKN
ncbi:uncharacterized protein LOC122256259 [Penaeus japonicus]|uniref:uncharacterized protein LOC122256259 n=1 Tax=Penaeus japonicus TaxID=27405 RepID=UPI001C70FE40|nr:uncharacterized protein LOC122256259 [Penaeus japonicus]XP_042876737.1 uncharacterized protein LOC122256259 [Penaeus japonicus]XP_042876738.1 uncharacterized protein LOC122256259 [Penaeus japonicus]XP_042876739.1 uncharacterized protein LOC122256259 [Penaeus japonicus]